MVSTAPRGIVASTTSASRRMGIVRIASRRCCRVRSRGRHARELCERDVEFHEGPHAARKYQFVARGVAQALVAVGAGSSYRDAAGVARERARRLRVDEESGELRFSRHGSPVCDWVEVFGPVVFEAHRPREWPASRSLLLDAYRSACATQTAVASESRSGCSPRSGMTADAPSCGAWRRFTTKSQPDARRRFWARSVALRTGRLRQPLRAHEARSVLASPRRCARSERRSELPQRSCA